MTQEELFLLKIELLSLNREIPLNNEQKKKLFVFLKLELK